MRMATINKVAGAVANSAVTASIVSDSIEFFGTGKISPARFVFRTVGNGLSLLASRGDPRIALTIGIGFPVVEAIYDHALVPAAASASKSLHQKIGDDPTGKRLYNFVGQGVSGNNAFGLDL